MGEVTCGKLPHLTCKRDHNKMRDYMDRRLNPPKRVTSPTWGPPPPCKQALNLYFWWAKWQFWLFIKWIWSLQAPEWIQSLEIPQKCDSNKTVQRCKRLNAWVYSYICKHIQCSYSFRSSLLKHICFCVPSEPLVAKFGSGAHWVYGALH